MSRLRNWFFVALLFAGISLRGTESGDVKSFEAHNLSVRSVLKFYEHLSGKPVVIPPDMDVDTTRVSFRFAYKTEAEAMRAVGIFLIVQARMRIVHEADGTFTIRRIELTQRMLKPNHVPDPASPSVTPPAGAGGAPSVAADH